MRTLLKQTFALLLAALLLAAPAIHAAGADEKAAILAAMSTEQKIAQMLMPTFRYYNGAGVTALSDKAKQIIARRGFGGVILFSQNNDSTAQTVRLIDELQRENARSGAPQLLISVDQEGGSITRLASGTQGPGNMALGATGDSANAYIMGSVIGSELTAVGYNVDFAPVADVNSNPANPVIGIRSFSDDAGTVAEFASAFMAGLQSENVITALKHFPGHGDAAVDSHTGLPRIEKTYKELKSCELIPFIRCIEEGADMIMTAHIQYPLIEKETYVSVKDGREIELPATLSKTIITDVLRNDLGFEGVVVTDAMNMAAIAGHFAPLDAAKLAIEAGVDILLTPVDPGSDAGIEALDRYISDVAALVDAGEISSRNVDRAVTRILTMKEKHRLLTPYEAPDLAEKTAYAERVVGSGANHAVEWEIAKSAVTLVKNDGMLPIRNAGKTVIMVPYANEVNSAEYAVERLKQEGLVPEDADISVFLTNGATLEETLAAAAGAKTVIAVAEQYSEAGLAAAQYERLDAAADLVHKNGGKIAFLSCWLPYDAARLQKGDAILLAYSAMGMAEKPDFANGSVLTYGVGIPAGLCTAFDPDATLGVLPVSIPKLDASYAYTSEYLYERGFGLRYHTDKNASDAHRALSFADMLERIFAFFRRLITVFFGGRRVC